MGTQIYDSDDLKAAYNKGRVDAIEEIYAKTKSKIEWLLEHYQGRRNGKTHAMYCMQALDFMHEFAKELQEVNE